MSNEERKVEIVEGGGKKGEGADQAIEMQKLEDIRKEEKGSSLSKGQGSLRQKKADVSITVN